LRGIKTKFVVYFSILVLLSTISVGFFMLFRGSEILVGEVERSLTSIATESAKVIESRLEAQMKILEMISLRDDIQSMDWEVQQSILEEQKAKTNFGNIGVITPDGNAHYSNGVVLKLDKEDYIERAWEGKFAVSDVIFSELSQKPVLTYAAPIKSGDEVAGVLVGDWPVHALSEFISDIGFGEEGYAYMINGEGTVVAHPDWSRVIDNWNPIKESEGDETQKPVAKLFEKILEEKSGIGKYSFEGVSLYAGYEPVPGTDWIMVVNALEQEMLAVIPKLQNEVMLIIFVILAVGIVISFILGNSIATPIVNVADYSKIVANLDMRQDVPETFLRRKDEIGILANGLQNIVTNLRDIINEVQISSMQVVSTSEQLTASTQQSATAAEEVSNVAEEIAKGAADQAHNTENGSNKAILLGETIEQDAKHMEELNTDSKNVVVAIEEGLQDMENLRDITERSNSALKEIYEVIQKTNESSHQIEQASNLISSIAEQTNLLALNAAIEAARAGEAGRGFAVVAEEIRKLAEESRISTETIDNIVKELQQNAEKAVETMDIVANITEEQTGSVSSSRDRYMQISNAMENTQNTIHQLNLSAQAMDRIKEDILETLQNLAAIAEENSASTEEVTASMEEQAASIEEIASSSEALADLAQGLQVLVERFKI